MLYEPPFKIRKKPQIERENDYSVIVVQEKRFLIDKEDESKVSCFWWRYNGGYLYSSNKYDTSIALHRLIMNLGRGDKRIVDHINQNTTDNRKSNLRITNRAGNMMNVSKPQGSNPYRGVNWNKNRNTWYVYISFRANGKRNRIYGGCYRDLEMARAKRLELEKIYFKEFSAST